MLTIPNLIWTKHQPKGYNNHGEKVSELNKSPSGSICPYYYMGGELHSLKYGIYFTDKQKLFAVNKAAEEGIHKM